MRMERGVIRAFDSVNYLADVQIVGSMATLLEDIPVSKSIGESLVVDGAKCGVVFFDPTNPSDACVAFIYEGAPVAWVTSGLIVDGAVGAAEIADGAVGAGEIADGAVAFAELAVSAKGQILLDEADSPQTTTSTTYVDMAGSSLSVVIPAGQTADLLLIGLATAENNTAGKRTRMCTNWNGTDGPAYAFESDPAGQRGSLVALQVVDGVGAGTYTAKLRKSVDGGTGTYRGPILVAVVVPAS